jgi:hypothetical protein
MATFPKKNGPVAPVGFVVVLDVEGGAGSVPVVADPVPVVEPPVVPVLVPPLGGVCAGNSIATRTALAKTPGICMR